MPPKSDPLAGPSHIPLIYDRSPERRRSPSPSLFNSYFPYNRYPPTRDGFREGHQNILGRNSWRPEPSYYNAPPSPERFGPPANIDTDYWDRPVPWTPPNSGTWPRRRGGSRGFRAQHSLPRSSETMATRMFEPSESWKQTHHEPPPVPPMSRSYDRLPEFPMQPMPPFTPPRPIRDHYSPPPEHYPSPPDRYLQPDHYSPPRNHYSPPQERYSPEHHYSSSHFAGDRYRPYSPTPPPPPPSARYPYMNHRSDSYRPQYDDDRGPTRSSYSASPYANQFDDRYSARSFSLRPRTPEDEVRQFRSPARSPSRSSSRATSIYSPTTARIHSPDPYPSNDVSSSPISSGATSKPVNTFAYSREPTALKRSLSRSSSRSSDVPGLVIQTQEVFKVESVPPAVSQDVDSLASTPHEDIHGTSASTKLNENKLDEAMQQLHASSHGDVHGSSFGEDNWDQEDPPGLHRISESLNPLPSSFVRKYDGREIHEPMPSGPKVSAIATRQDDGPETHSLNSSHPSLKSLVTVGSTVAELVADGHNLLNRQVRSTAEESDMEMSLPPSPMDEVRKDYDLRQSSLVSDSILTQPIESWPAIVSSSSPTPPGSDMDMSPPPSPRRRSHSPLALDIQDGRSMTDHQEITESRPRVQLPKLPSSPKTQLKITTDVSMVIKKAPESMTHHEAHGGNQFLAEESDMDVSLPGSPVQEPIVEGHEHALVNLETLESGDVTVSLPSPASPPARLEHLDPSLVHDGDMNEEASAPSEFDPATTVPNAISLHESEARHEEVRLVDDSGDDSGIVPSLPASILTPQIAGAVVAEESIGVPSEMPVVHDRASQQKAVDDVPEPPAAAISEGHAEVSEATERPEGRQEGPDIQDENPLAQGLRLVVMTRLRCDRQTKEERVGPVLWANHSIAEVPRPTATADAVIREVFQGERLQAREDIYVRVKPSLQTRFAQRQAVMTEKVQKIRKEYLALHDRWMAHCAKLDEVAKAAALEEAAATAGRTTRRSAAMGDAVRTDLEMEQIIASLGNEELTDANHLAARNAAKIPDMVSVERGLVQYVFDDTNNVIDSPVSFYTPNTCLEDWTEEEKSIFLEKYALYPKQFGIIADFLPQKTAAQCVTFYYLHKKTTIDFRDVVSRHTTGKRKRGGKRADKKKGNALLTDIRKHDDEMSRDSTPSGPTTRRRRGAQPSGAEGRRAAPSRRSTTHVENSPISTPTPEPEARRRRRPTKPTARAVAAMELDAEDEPTETAPKPAKRGRRSRKIKSAETVDSPVMSEELPILYNETRFIDQTEMTARKKTAPGNVYWSEEDKELFLQLLAQHGENFKRIAASMPNKTTIQVSVFYKANMAGLGLAKVAGSAPKRSPSPDVPLDNWREMTFPGSGVITPSTRASTPGTNMQPPMAALGLDTPIRARERSSSSLQAREASASSERGRRAPDVPSEAPVMSSSSSGSFQFRSTSVEAMRAQYGPGTSLDVAPRAYPTLQPRPSPFPSVPPPNGALMMGDPIRMSNPGASTGAPLTMTFPSSFAYSNLSPSHFAGEPRLPPRAVPMRGVTPPNASAASTTMTFDASVFTQQPWSFRSYSPGDGDTVSNPGTSGVPTTLQTTDDLRVYLEHRTRLAEQRPSDFM